MMTPPYLCDGCFEGKVIMITGAASGIGRETATEAAALGASLVLVDRNADGLAETAALIGEDKGLVIARNLTDVDQVAELPALVAARFGRLDGLVNAAGLTGDAAPLAECSLETWHTVMDVNLNAIFYVMRAMIPMLLETKGAIVNMSSVAGLVAVPDQVQYVTSKFGVIGLTKAAAIDYAPKGLRVNALCPGGIRTPMLQSWVDADPSRERFLAAGHPVGRIGEAHEMASAILWLLSPAASFVTGTALVADGGLTIS